MNACAAPLKRVGTSLIASPPSPPSGQVIEALRSLPISGRVSMSGNPLTRSGNSLTQTPSSQDVSPAITHSHPVGLRSSASAVCTSEPTDAATRTTSGGSGPVEPPSPTTRSRAASIHAPGPDGTGSRGGKAAVAPLLATAKAVPASPFAVDEIPTSMDSACDAPDRNHNPAAVSKVPNSPLAVDEILLSTDGSVPSRPASPVGGPLASPFTPDELPLSMRG